MEMQDEQIRELKKQILQHIESTFPEDKKKSAIENVNTMDKKEFLEFLKKNKLIDSKLRGKYQQHPNENPFRMIIERKIPSYEIDENKYCLAVLEINPISKGHIIIIPKKAISESSKIPQPVFSLAKKISRKIKTKFKPKEVSISSLNSLGEIIINVLPIYGEENINSQRKQASEEELKDLKKKLEKKQRAKTIKQARIKKIEEPKIWFPKRIP